MTTTDRRALTAAAVAIGLAVVGCALCASSNRFVRIGGGGVLAAACLMYALIWAKRELPGVRRGWSQFVRSSPRVEPLDLIGLVVLTSIGSVLRVASTFQPIRYDEAATLMAFAAQPLIVGLSRYDAPNNHLLHTFLLHITQSLLGTDEWAIRIPALVAGALMIPATYLAARALYGRGAGLLSAGLVASSAVLVDYSADARGYTLIGLITLLLIALAAQLRSSWNAPGLFVFGVLSALGFYSVPVMLYPWGAVLLWLLLSSEHFELRERLRRISASVGVTACLTLSLYTPVLVRAGFGALAMNRFVAPRPWSELLIDWPSTLASVWHDWSVAVPLALQIACVCGVLVSLGLHRQQHRSGVPLLVAMAVWIIPLVVVQRVVPFERVWLFLLPICFSAAVDGWLLLLRPMRALVAPLRSTMVAFASLGLAVYMAVQVRGLGMPPRETEAAATFLVPYLQANADVIAGVPADWPLRYYLWKRGVGGVFTAGSEDLPGATRTFVFVDSSSGQSLAEVARTAGLTPDVVAASKMVWHLGSTAVYQLPGGPPVG